MTRLTRLLLASSFLTFTYLLLLLDILPLALPFTSPETKEALLPVLPWWALVSLGAYCLASLGKGILTFGECGDAYEELLKEIGQAKDDLRSQGISVD